MLEQGEAFLKQAIHIEILVSVPFIRAKFSRPFTIPAARKSASRSFPGCSCERQRRGFLQQHLRVAGDTRDRVLTSWAMPAAIIQRGELLRLQQLVCELHFLGDVIQHEQAARTRVERSAERYDAHVDDQLRPGRSPR